MLHPPSKTVRFQDMDKDALYSYYKGMYKHIPGYTTSGIVHVHTMNLTFDEFVKSVKAILLIIVAREVFTLKYHRGTLDDSHRRQHRVLIEILKTIYKKHRGDYVPMMLVKHKKLVQKMHKYVM